MAKWRGVGEGERVICASFQRKGKAFRPGLPVDGIGPEGIVRHAWAGFSRAEILSWWQQKGGVLIDLPPERFAERSDVTGKLVWSDVPEGLVIRGLMDRQSSEPLIKVVTRAATDEEQAYFQHPRMPMLEALLHEPQELPEEAEEGFLF